LAERRYDLRVQSLQSEEPALLHLGGANRRILLALLLFYGASAIATAQSRPAAQAASGSALVVNGDVPTPLSFSLDDLRHMPRETVTAMNAHTGKEETYQGVPLAELWKRAGLPQGEKLRGGAMTTYVIAEGADSYRALFSAAELDSSFRDSDVIVADTLDGASIGAGQGPLKLVAPHDKRPARWVRMLRSLTIAKAPK
jgi:DMSO/TMAO reductase YedYZ molybdopterin-dependent catalytic subunit